jgi:hypothetical protein
MHLDLRVNQLEGGTPASPLPGATQLSNEIVKDGFHWCVMAYPEGNEFCVIRESDAVSAQQ